MDRKHHDLYKITYTGKQKQKHHKTVIHLDTYMYKLIKLPNQKAVNTIQYNIMPAHSCTVAVILSVYTRWQASMSV